MPEAFALPKGTNVINVRQHTSPGAKLNLRRGTCPSPHRASSPRCCHGRCMAGEVGHILAAGRVDGQPNDGAELGERSLPYRDPPATRTPGQNPGTAWGQGRRNQCSWIAASVKPVPKWISEAIANLAASASIASAVRPPTLRWPGHRAVRERTFCAHGLAYAYYSSRHSYSAGQDGALVLVTVRH